MSRFHCVGRSSPRQVISIPLIIIVASSTFTNIFAAVNVKYKTDFDALCLATSCDILQYAVFKSNIVDKITSLATEFIKKEAHAEFKDNMNEIRTTTRNKYEPRFKMFKKIPKAFNIPTNTSVLRGLNEERTLMDLYDYLRIIHIRVFLSGDNANEMKMLSPRGIAIFKDLTIEAIEVIDSIERLLSPFNVKGLAIPPGLFHEARWISTHFRAKDGEQDLMMYSIKVCFYEFILLMEFTNDVLKHFSTKYCGNIVQNKAFTPSNCQFKIHSLIQ